MTGQTLAIYAAGLFDGEGCVAARCEKNYSRSGRCYPLPRVKVTITMTDPRPLRLLHQAYGGSLLFYPSKNPRWKGKWNWWLGPRQSAKFLADVLPFLTVKREQAELAIALYGRTNNYPSRSYGRHGKEPLPLAEVEARTALVTQIQALKHQTVN